MDMSVESAVSTALAMQSMKLGQDAQMLVLKKSLDAQASTLASLVQSIPQMPQLATHGAVGTNVNTFA